MYLTNICKANVSWSSLGSLENHDQSYLMFESPCMINLPATSGRYIDNEHLWTLIKLKGITVAGQQAACKDANPIQSKTTRCALAVWLLLLPFVMKELKQQSWVVKTIYGAVYGRIAGCDWLIKEANKKRVACHTQVLFGQLDFKLGNRHKQMLFYTPIFQTSMVLWEKRQKQRIQNLEETWFIAHNHFGFHDNDYLCIKNALFILAKERSKSRHSQLEHLLQKSEQPQDSKRKWLKNSSTGDSLDGCQGGVTLLL